VPPASPHHRQGVPLASPRHQLRTRLKATNKMINPSSTPRMKKRACIVRIALAEHNQSSVSIIKDTLPTCSQEAVMCRKSIP
jgi:hypothetical protein